MININKNELVIECDVFLKFCLTINFKKNKNFWILESKQFKIKIESINDNLDDAKEEFVEIILKILKMLIRKKIIFDVFKFLKIKNEFNNKNDKSINLKKIKINYNWKESNNIN